MTVIKLHLLARWTMLKNLIGDNTKVIDLQGKILTPGFIEGHGHLMGVGYNELKLDFRKYKDFDEMIEKVREAVAKAHHLVNGS